MRVDNTDLENAIYQALAPELEKLEFDKVLFSNGHHVAQRLVPLIRASVQELLERAQGQATLGPQPVRSNY